MEDTATTPLSDEANSRPDLALQHELVEDAVDGLVVKRRLSGGEVFVQSFRFQELLHQHLPPHLESPPEHPSDILALPHIRVTLNKSADEDEEPLSRCLKLGNLLHVIGDSISDSSAKVAIRKGYTAQAKLAGPLVISFPLGRGRSTR